MTCIKGVHGWAGVDMVRMSSNLDWSLLVPYYNISYTSMSIRKSDYILGTPNLYYILEAEAPEAALKPSRFYANNDILSS